MKQHMATINLATKYSNKIDEKFTLSSRVKGNTSNDYELTGVKSVRIYTPVTQELADYIRSGTSRYGAPKEMEDTIQELTMTQDKAFSITIDKGNYNEQQMVKKAGRMMAMEMDEQVVPTIDKYALNRYCELAGQNASLSSAPTKSSIVGNLFDCAAAMDNKLVPADSRVLYIKSTYYNLLRQSSEFLAVDNLAAKALTKGVVGEAADMTIVKVPDSYLPENVYFLATYKRSVILTQKIRDSKLHTDPPGISGALLEGRFNYDAFVLSAKADGVYVAAASAGICAAPTIAISSNVATITNNASGSTVKYTTDGSDPRYSATANVYTATVTLTSGQTIKACSVKSGMIQSSVAEKKNA